MSNVAVLDLPDGQSFRYTERPSHGQIKIITRALLETQRILFGTAEGDPLDIQTITVLTLGNSWVVRDDEGRDLPWSREGIEAAEQSIVEQCYAACEKAIAGASPALANDLQGTPQPGKRGKPSPNR